ncbi:MAG: PEP/pyruvate-binding domain-containing protein [Salinivirgaceae bacterium]|nr:PEP/pyruvate-binding domain-containing protein [Salinivirgaceae bacterium]
MDNVIKSDALEANLTQTKSVEYVIPDNHTWFLSLSENYWGIHKSTQEFLLELHHPYSNRKEVVELLSKIALSDFWIYKGIEEQEKAIRTLLGIFDLLLEQKLADDLSKRLVYIFLDFFDKNHDSFVEFDSLPTEFIRILDANLKSNFFGYLSNLGSFKKHLKKGASCPKMGEAIFAFMKKITKENIDFWKKTTDIEKWYDDNKGKMSHDYSQLIQSLGKEFFDDQYQRINEVETWEALNKVAFTFSDIIDAFRKNIDNFKTSTEQFSYIFYLIHLPGMVYHRNYLLIDLNNAIKRISTELNEEECIQSIDDLFVLFADFQHSHVNYILDSILTLGKEIINTQNGSLIHYYENRIIQFGFINPGVAYLTNNWELKVNPNHIKNIRVWLDLIEYDPETMKKLLSALIINLRIGGIFIFDTDLFQKDVTKLLNSKISPLYKQIKQLTRIFPIYFNEIGAEGLLRDVTTKIDEITHRNDKLIHFLRKQIHTEGNNSHIQITYDIIQFWTDLDKKRLKEIVPKNVYSTIDVKSIWVTGVHTVISELCQNNNLSLDELLKKDKTELSELLKAINHNDQNDTKRVSYIVELYQLLKEKYLFETTDIGIILRRYNLIDNAEIEKLEALLDSKNNVEALKLIYSFMVHLNEIIFNPVKSEGWESIYYKRHIAFGIPSMYGQYREDKFEALGLTFRLERIASVLVDSIVTNINTEYFTAKTLKDIFSVIQLLREGLSLDGIYDQGLDSNLKMLQHSLTSGSFTIKQYINIFMFMEVSIKEIINKYFIRPYDKTLNVIVPQYLPQDEDMPNDVHKKIVLQKSEMFYRELLSSAFLIQALDNFIGRVLVNLRKMVSDLSEKETQSIMTYDVDMVISPLYQETLPIDNQVFLGSKAYFLKKLYLNKFPVPPGFVITTEVFRRIKSILKMPSLNAEIDNLIKHYISELEQITGLKYGDSEKPLLLSVRSGAAISMPGAMNTFLNVGLNDEITEALSRRNNFGWTSWDCYRRLLQTWGMSHGLERNDFDQIMIDYKQKHNIMQKTDFSPKIMREMAFAYKQFLVDNNIQFESDPFLQIKKAIISVFNSWDTPRAKVYRKHLQIADEWGTAVIVQQMIFGNLHKKSGSGVLFTHDVHENASGIKLAGDFSFLSQGEDIVAGLISTLPISEKQRVKYYQKTPFSLESAFPKIFGKLQEIAHDLIDIHGFGHQEIEFTFETPEPEGLYILQTRNMSIVKQDKMEVFDTPENDMIRVGCGIGIGNKVLNGVIVFDKEDFMLLKQKYPDKNAVLVRPDTVPDDIEMIFECEGLLTARGGATSHAAVTASTLGKTCVVNCSEMVVYEKDKRCIINDVVFVAHDPIAIDGNKGVVYKGNYPVKIQEL